MPGHFHYCFSIVAEFFAIITIKPDFSNAFTLARSFGAVGNLGFQQHPRELANV